MPLSLTAEFTRADITGIRVYKQGKVYLLQGRGPDIVVKQEDINIANAQYFDYTKKTMGLMDKDVKASKRLTQNELNALYSFVSIQKAEVEFGLKHRLPGATADLDSALLAMRNAAKVWFKMPNIPMVTLRDVWESKIGYTMDHQSTGPSVACEQSNEPARMFAKTLKAPGGLESLGKILAADLFSGNKDRIGFKTTKKSPFMKMESVNDQNYKFQAISNIGNFIMIGPGNAKTISGMDFADPNSILKHLDHSLDQQTSIESWKGEVLANAVSRKQLAKDIVSDLEMVLTSGAHLHKQRKDFWGRVSGDQTVLDADAAKRLEAGMLSGVKMLNKYVKDKTKAGKQFPQSFQDRAAVFANIA